MMFNSDGSTRWTCFVSETAFTFSHKLSISNLTGFLPFLTHQSQLGSFLFCLEQLWEVNLHYWWWLFLWWWSLLLNALSSSNSINCFFTMTGSRVVPTDSERWKYFWELVANKCKDIFVFILTVLAIILKVNFSDLISK